MSREEDESKIDKLLNDNFEWSKDHGEYFSRSNILDISHELIAYGRSTPDREMLVRLLQYTQILYSTSFLECNFTDEKAREFINLFLTLENQRGEK